ncbi:hypothetical protein CIB48_g10551 [Xylaria polymorpha]|nr:hypothetical protein CIB48_g10551 [Xylaria polymorpha]
MASGEQELTHNEIWDDSALIDSWDQALEEYKKYHSIHRNGGNVNDLLKLKEAETSDAKLNPHEIDEPSNSGRLETASEMKEENLDNRQETGNVTTQHSQPHISGPPPALLSTIRNEGLKQLLMSWYYAGYYTGYYEGQHDSPRHQGPSK